MNHGKSIHQKYMPSNITMKLHNKKYALKLFLQKAEKSSKHSPMSYHKVRNFYERLYKCKGKTHRDWMWMLKTDNKIDVFSAFQSPDDSHLPHRTGWYLAQYCTCVININLGPNPIIANVMSMSGMCKCRHQIINRAFFWCQ